MRRLIYVCLILVLTFLSFGARAAVIDFETVSVCGAEGFSVPQGFSFSAADTHLCVVDQGFTKELVYQELSSYRDLSIILWGNVSEPFSLNSFDSRYGRLHLTGYKAGGGYVEFDVGSLSGKQTVYLPDTFVDLTQVWMVPQIRYWPYYDNFVVNEAFTPVPLPGGLGLLLSGFVLLFGRLNRVRLD